jgi:hypothetical protein
VSAPDDLPEEAREGFLSRWSRRKRVVLERGEEPDAAPPDDAPAEEPVAETPPAAPVRAACPIPNLPEIDLSALPRIEDLTAESDFAVFLRPGVPGALRNAALRRMWTLDPSIRDYIGPVEYQWDFNAPGGLPLGFSAELGGDVAKLLAQAIGKVEEVAGRLGTGEESGEATVPPAPAAPEAPPATVAEALPPPNVPPGVPRDLPRDTEPQPARRRHGGALPI